MKTTFKHVDWSGKSKVYIAKDNSVNGFYKIGCSKDPLKRCRTIGSKNCEIIFQSEPDYYNGTEIFAHSLLDDRRHTYIGSGKTEWFKLSDYELKIIKAAIKIHSEYVSLARKYSDAIKNKNNEREPA